MSIDYNNGRPYDTQTGQPFNGTLDVEPRTAREWFDYEWRNMRQAQPLPYLKDAQNKYQAAAIECLAVRKWMHTYNRTTPELLRWLRSQHRDIHFYCHDIRKYRIRSHFVRSFMFNWGK